MDAAARELHAQNQELFELLHDGQQAPASFWERPTFHVPPAPTAVRAIQPFNPNVFVPWVQNDALERVQRIEALERAQHNASRFPSICFEIQESAAEVPHALERLALDSDITSFYIGISQDPAWRWSGTSTQHVSRQARKMIPHARAGWHEMHVIHWGISPRIAALERELIRFVEEQMEEHVREICANRSTGGERFSGKHMFLYVVIKTRLQDPFFCRVCSGALCLCGGAQVR